MPEENNENLEYSMKDNLKTAWDENPGFRIVSVVVVIILVLAGSIATANIRKMKKETASKITQMSGAKDSPFEEKSEAYREALAEDEEQRIDDAVKKGESVLPYTGTFETRDIDAVEIEEGDSGFLSMLDLEKLGYGKEKPVETKIEYVEVPADCDSVCDSSLGEDGSDRYGSGEDGSDRYGSGEDGSDRYGSGRSGYYTPEQQQAMLDFQVGLMGSQIGALVQVTDPIYNQVIVTDVLAMRADGSYSDSYYGKDDALLDENKLLSEIEKDELIITAGTISYAVTLTESNSDVPAPVLAKIVTGPLKGFKVLGSFTTQDDYLTIEFRTAILGHEEYNIEAFALDPETTLPGIATDINRHYFNRYLLPIAATFIEGLGNAVADNGTEVVISDGVVTESKNKQSTNEQIWAGVGDASTAISDIIDEEVEDGPTIKVGAGTEIGMLFTRTLYGKASRK